MNSSSRRSTAQTQDRSTTTSTARSGTSSATFASTTSRSRALRTGKSLYVAHLLALGLYDLPLCYRHSLTIARLSFTCEWLQFDEMSVVLAAFEGNAFSSDDLERTRDLLTATASSERDASQDHYFQPKYLTNSRLFRLQLRDPILRESMLTQFLILFHYLAKAKVPADATTPKAKVAEMHARVAKLLEQTPSDSEGFSDLVARVLERERNWTKWKQEKCPPYEKYAAAAGSPKKKPQAAAPRLGDAGALGARPAFVKRVRNGADKDTSSLMEQILTESAKPSELLAKIKGSERGTSVCQPLSLSERELM